MTFHHRKPTKSFSFSLYKSIFLSIAMASFTLLSLFSLLLFFSLSHSSHHRHSPPSRTTPMAATAPLSVKQACKATRFPDACAGSLAGVSPDSSPAQVIAASIGVSSENLRTAQSMVKTILDSSSGNKNRSGAAANCVEFLRNSEYRISGANEALPRGRSKDARAWMSAALLYQYDCWSALKYANDTQLVNQTMSFLDSSLIVSSSNVLSMMASYDNFGNETSSWGPPRTERDGFWESGSGAASGLGLGSGGGFPSNLTADVTVCKGGGCDFEKVQDGVNAAPNDVVGGKRFVIHVKEGVYEETVRIGIEKKKVVLLGDGMGKTIITASLNVGQTGISTYNTATVGVLGDGFMASGLTIQNMAGPDAHQAIAFRSDSDLSVVENCEFIGNQDTLYAHSLRQFYKSCRIQGNVDFIFGNSASIFQDCVILVRPRQLMPEKGEKNAVTAHGRTDPAQSTGFVFQNCLINGTDEYMKLYYSKPQVHNTFLGRPWKEYSRTVFIHCNLEALITPQGWLPWSQDFALKTLFYGELENSGAGSDVSQRVTWSSQIPAEHVNSYSVQSFIQGDEWIPTNEPPTLSSSYSCKMVDKKKEH